MGFSFLSQRTKKWMEPGEILAVPLISLKVHSVKRDKINNKEVHMEILLNGIECVLKKTKA